MHDQQRYVFFYTLLYKIVLVNFDYLSGYLITLNYFKMITDTARLFSQPPLISFKRDKNIGNFLVKSAFQTSNQPGTFKCARARCINRSVHSQR